MIQHKKMIHTTYTLIIHYIKMNSTVYGIIMEIIQMYLEVVRAELLQYRSFLRPNRKKEFGSLFQNIG